MKWIFALLVALVAGALAGSWIKNLPGFVIIAFDKTSYEMRLWIAVCLLLLLLTLIFIVVAIVGSVFNSAGKVKNWHGGRGWRRSRKQTIEGMLAFTEGRWAASEQAMIAAAKSSDTKLINYLIAAQAAQQQNAEVRRDAYLRQAFQTEPAAKTAIGLTQAQLQIQHQQYEQALASLNELKIKNPNHPFVLKLLSQLFERLQEWSQLIALLPALKKQRVLSDAELTRLEETSVAGILEKCADAGQVESLKDNWLNLPTAYRKSKANRLSYVRLLIGFEEMDEADGIMRSVLKKHANGETLHLYGLIRASDPAKQLSFLESWLKNQPSPPAEVYLTLGKFAYFANLWGKARHFLEQALQLNPSAEAYLFMAQTLIHLDDEQHAADCFQKGLEFAALPKTDPRFLSLPSGSADLVTADLLPKFQKLEHKPS